MQPPRSTADQQRPPQVPHHQRFPEGPNQGRAQQIGLVVDAHQPAKQTCVAPVELRAANQPFARVAKPGLQQKHQAAALQQRQPFPSGAAGDAHIPGELGPVEQLARTQRTSSQEALELQQVAHLLQAA